MKTKVQLKKVKPKKTSQKKHTTRKSAKPLKKKVTIKRLAAKKETGLDQHTLVGQPASEIVLAATGGKNLSVKDFKGKVVVIYFYPKDHTPGCTLEGQDFSRLQSQFSKLDAVVLGVSRDSVASHEKFKEKQKYGFDLISDPEEQLCNAYLVMQPKVLYGRKFIGVERSTFVIDRQGRISKEWRKVKVAGHAAEVLEYVRSIARDV